ncbi:aminotransferase class V-fold PLP-dependent enzyme [Microbacterium allomyrinae]|uniref:Aminotransferase class V-fold PLP-dependent enzyme n=1 Tax=Microbacterium allomyrinae TaxID=2830666 RepID=A0A9X1LUY6_9MICO|nr:aminotransferase class V-fold PLP-dependent enzyme [Microbacterium allomyrinae]MCC2032500.1 aminotransferase class V-fold PLP-dependent enzyme [Microbacterium allomyrinae]
MTSVPAADAAQKEAVLPRIGSAIDVALERERTLGAHASHHFNAAGAALPTAAVVSAVVDHLRLEEQMGGYEAAAQVKDDIEAVYGSAARLLGSDADEIALFDSASTGLRVLLDALRPAAGSRIIASRSTYVSHALHLMTVRDEHDVELVLAPTDAHRRVDLDALDALLADGRPTILTIAHVPTSSGLVEPVAEIGHLARRYGAVYLLDATQSVGHLGIDVAEIGCHVLVTTGRKFLRAPRGTALAYVERRTAAALAPTAPDVRGSQWLAEGEWDVATSARRFETWESSVAGRLGLGVALEEASRRGIAETAGWLTSTGGLLRESLREIPGVVIADPADSRSAIVTFLVEGLPSAHAAALLAERQVRVVSVPATHGQWDLGDRAIASVVRASPHVYNDESDLAALIDGVAHIAREGARR